MFTLYGILSTFAVKLKHYPFRQCISYPHLYVDWVYVSYLKFILSVHFTQFYPKCYLIGYNYLTLIIWLLMAVYRM